MPAGGYPHHYHMFVRVQSEQRASNALVWGGGRIPGVGTAGLGCGAPLALGEQQRQGRVGGRMCFKPLRLGVLCVTLSQAGSGRRVMQNERHGAVVVVIRFTSVERRPNHQIDPTDVCLQILPNRQPTPASRPWHQAA
jgi:hypothetical protein